MHTCSLHGSFGNLCRRQEEGREDSGIIADMQFPKVWLCVLNEGPGWNFKLIYGDGDCWGTTKELWAVGSAADVKGAAFGADRQHYLEKWS